MIFARRPQKARYVAESAAEKGTLQQRRQGLEADPGRNRRLARLAKAFSRRAGSGGGKGLGRILSAQSGARGGTPLCSGDEDHPDYARTALGRVDGPSANPPPPRQAAGGVRPVQRPASCFRLSSPLCRGQTRVSALKPLIGVSTFPELLNWPAEDILPYFFGTKRIA